MTLRYDPRERDAQTILDWARPARLRYMDSHAYRVLKRLVQSYVDGEIAGRSILISGPRGAGKTALVGRVVEDVGEETFDAWVEHAELLEDADDDDPPAPPRRPLRRPLLVRLHGPSLIAAAETAPPKADPPEPGPPPAAKDASKGETKADPAPPPLDPANALAHATLKQVAITLYRAMANEFSNCFANQAASLRDRPEGDRLYELAAQFRLEADQGVEPIAARDYWTWFKALRNGVLWPRRFFPEGESDVAQRDQGLREIQALVTAAQCFRVCAYAISGKETQEDERTREAKAEAKFGGDLASVANRLAGVALGGLAGFGVGGAAGAAVGGGLVGAASGLWTFNRSRKRSGKVEYTFIRDFSLATLERDLPLVIERARRAGLAPIFIVDELDKVGQVDSAVSDIIDRLKHLTTDYGFFCFLTGGDYFDYVEAKLRSGDYPPEYTYFSQRLFVSYSPREVAQYLSEVIRAEPAEDAPPGDRDAETLAAAMIRRLVMYRSRMHAVEMMRALADAAERDLREDPFRVVSRFANRLTVAVQLAVELQLEQGDLSAFLEARPRLRQLALDLAYRFARVWESGAPLYADLPLYTLRALAKWLKIEAPADMVLKDGSKPTAAFLKELDAICRKLGPWPLARELIKSSLAPERIQSFAELRAEVVGSALIDRRDIGQAIPAGLSGGLLEFKSALVWESNPESDFAPPEAYIFEESRFAFVFESFGRYFDVSAHRGLIGEAYETGTLLKSNIEELRLEFENLTHGGLLPPTVNWTEVKAMLGAPAGDPPARTLDHAPEIEAFLAAIRRAEASLTWELALAARLRRDLRDRVDADSQPYTVDDLYRWIAAVRTFFGRSGTLPFAYPPLDRPMPQGERQSILGADWTEFLDGVDAEDLTGVGAAQGRRWRVWADRASTWLTSGAAPLETEYEDLMLAAEGLAPSALFHARFYMMNAVDWSRLALEGARLLVEPAESSHPWLILAGLAGLQFAEDLLAPVRTELELYWSTDAPPAANYRSRFPARDGRGGQLIVFRDLDGAQFVPQVDSSTLLVAEKDLERYAGALTWLRKRRVFSELLYET